MSTTPPDPRFGTRKGIAGWPRKLRESWKRHPMRTIIIAALVVVVAVLGWIFLREPVTSLFKGEKDRPVAASTQAPSPKGPAPVAPVEKATAAPAPVLNATPAPAPAPAPAATSVASVAKPAPVLASQVSTPARKPGQPREWRNFGADKAYPTRAAAIADAPRVLRELGYPEQVIALLTEKMKRPGEFRGIVNGDMFEWMRSGPREIWRNDVLVNFQRPPTAGMGFYAESEEWSVEYQGVTWVTGIPKVCNNLYGYRLAAAKPRCYTLTANHKHFNEGGYVRWGIGSTTGRLKDDPCNAYRQGNGRWDAWAAPCTECLPGEKFLRRVLGASARWVQAYKYDTTHRKQTYRFSEEVLSKVLYMCHGRASDGTETCGVYMRPEDWKGRYDVTVDDSLWRPDNDDCPK